jgi:hypothetical protein
MVTIRSRSSWGARHPDGDITLSGLASEVFLHHTVTTHLPASATVEQESAQMRAIEAIGRSRFGKYGQGISYNVIIFPSGRAYQGVSWNRRGAHTDGRNSTARSICFAGNYEANEPTRAQLETAAAIYAEGRGKWWKSSAPVRGHRDIKSTACPGRKVYKHRAAIKAGTISGGTAPAPAWTGAMGWPVLRRGDTGGGVRGLQQELRGRGYDIGAAGVDGDFGPATEGAAKAFQRGAGLDPDGVVGADTQKALAQKDWFDMATKADLKAAVLEVINSGDGRKALTRAVWETDGVIKAPADTDVKNNPEWAASGLLRSARATARRAEAAAKANGAALDALAKSAGLDPADVRKTIADAVDKALVGLSITLTNEEG